MRWRTMILGDGGLGNGDAQLCQLAMLRGELPMERVGPAHVATVSAYTYFGSDSKWSSRAALPVLSAKTQALLK